MFAIPSLVAFAAVVYNFETYQLTVQAVVAENLSGPELQAALEQLSSDLFNVQLLWLTLAISIGGVLIWLLSHRDKGDPQNLEKSEISTTVEKQLKYAIEELPNPMIIYGLDDCLVYFNNAYREFFKHMPPLKN